MHGSTHTSCNSEYKKHLWHESPKTDRAAAALTWHSDICSTNHWADCQTQPTEQRLRLSQVIMWFIFLPWSSHLDSCQWCWHVTSQSKGIVLIWQTCHGPCRYFRERRAPVNKSFLCFFHIKVNIYLMANKISFM